MIPIELDKLRHIELSPGAMMDVEAMAGRGYISMISPEQMGQTSIVLFLWAGLKHEDPTLTPEKVRAIIDECWKSDKKILFRASSAIQDAIIEDGWFDPELLKDADTKNQ